MLTRTKSGNSLFKKVSCYSRKDMRELLKEILMNFWSVLQHVVKISRRFAECPTGYDITYSAEPCREGGRGDDVNSLQKFIRCFNKTYKAFSKVETTVICFQERDISSRLKGTVNRFSTIKDPYKGDKTY